MHFYRLSCQVEVIVDGDAGHTNRVREHCFLLEVSHELSDINQVVLGGAAGLLTRWQVFGEMM